MATIIPIAFNTGSTIPGTIQVGDLSIGQDPADYGVVGQDNGVKFWGSPDEDLGYLIAKSVPSGNQPNPLSGPAYVGFYRSESKTEASFLSLVNTQFGQNFSNGQAAVDWLNTNGYWTSFVPEPATPTPTPTVTPTRTPPPTPTPSVTPTNSPYPPDNWYFFLPTGTTPQAPTQNGQLLFTTNGASEVSYNPNTTDEVIFYLTDKSGINHSNYLDVVTYGGVLTMTQGSNTVILSADTGQWANYGSYISGNYLEVVQASPTSFVSGTPIGLVLTVNNPSSPTPTQTQTPTNTPTPSTTPIPVTGYGYNLIALPYNFPSSGNSIMNAASPQQTGTTLINELSTSQRGFYFNSIDNINVDRTAFYSQFTGQSVTITFTQNGDSAIYSGDSQSFKFWSGNTGTPPGVPGTGFVFGTNIGVPPSGTPSGVAVLIQSATTTWVTGSTVYVTVET